MSWKHSKHSSAELIIRQANYCFYFFSSITLVFRYFWRRARCYMCSKSTIITPLASFWSLYCWLWTHFSSCYSASIFEFHQLIDGWDSCLLETWKHSKEKHRKKHGNTWGIVTFFEGSIFGGRAYMQGNVLTRFHGIKTT